MSWFWIKTNDYIPFGERHLMVFIEHNRIPILAIDIRIQILCAMDFFAHQGARRKLRRQLLQKHCSCLGI
jgi:hypothetical protein